PVARRVGRTRTAHHESEDRLRREARPGRRTCVPEPEPALAQHRPDAVRLTIVETRPARVVLRQVDRAVDASPLPDGHGAHVVVAGLGAGRAAGTGRGGPRPGTG